MRFTLALILTVCSVCALAASLPRIFGGGQQPQPFSIVHSSDFHGGSGIVVARMTNLYNWIYSKTNDGNLNIKGMLWTGDNCEQATNYFGDVFDWTPAIMTNQIAEFTSRGLFFITCNGNHDADNFTDPNEGWMWYFDPANSNAMAWNNLFPLSTFTGQTNTVPGLRFVTNMTPNDSRNIVMTYTNSGIKLAFATFSSSFALGGAPYTNDVKAQIAPQTAWISNQITALPEYNSVFLAHFLLGCKVSDTNDVNFGLPILTNQDFTSTTYSNIAAGSYVFELGLSNCPNLFLGLSGHTRTLLKGHTNAPIMVGGRSVDLQCFNWQSAGGLGGEPNGTFASVLTFYPQTRTMLTRTFNVETGEELTNGAASAAKVFNGRTNHFLQSWITPIPLR